MLPLFPSVRHMITKRPVNYFEQAHSCRKRAEALRTIASAVHSPTVAEHLRQKALEWDRRAEEADSAAAAHPDEIHRKLD